METEIENFQSGFSGMPRVSQNHDESPKRRLQPILLLDEPLGFWTLLNRECLPALEAVRSNCPTREEFRTVESISSDFNITNHQSTVRIMTSTLP